MLRLLTSKFMIGGWKWADDFTTLDLIAAGTNALNGALLATGGSPQQVTTEAATSAFS